MNEEQAAKYVQELLKLMVSRKGSDLFLADDFAPSIKIDGKITAVSQQKLNAEQSNATSPSAPRASAASASTSSASRTP